MQTNKKVSILAILIGVMMLSLLSTPAQSRFSLTEERSAESDALYAEALFASLQKMNNEWSKFSAINYKDVIVGRSFLTQNLPTKQGDFNVTYLDTEGLIQRYKNRVARDKKEKARLPVFIARAPDFIKGRLLITFGVAYFSVNKKGDEYAHSDWSNVYFRYDCDKQIYVIDEVTLGGI